jgi:hypothetical protein
MSFLENKYSIWYYSIINNAQGRIVVGYIEKHHILPRSLGGSDDVSNIVNLSAREHFVCHLLLTKMTTGEDKIKMQHAVGKFIQAAPWQARSFTSWEYKTIRETISKVRTGTKRPGIGGVKKGTIPWNKGIKQGPHSEESNKKRSATMTGMKRSDEFCQKVSAGKKGHKAGMTGKKHSEETLQKMRQAVLNRKQLKGNN